MGSEQHSRAQPRALLLLSPALKDPLPSPLLCLSSPFIPFPSPLFLFSPSFPPSFPFPSFFLSFPSFSPFLPLSPFFFLPLPAGSLRPGLSRRSGGCGSTLCRPSTARCRSPPPFPTLTAPPRGVAGRGGRGVRALGRVGGARPLSRAAIGQRLLPAWSRCDAGGASARPIGRQGRDVIGTPLGDWLAAGGAPGWAGGLRGAVPDGRRTGDGAARRALRGRGAGTAGTAVRGGRAASAGPGGPLSGAGKASPSADPDSPFLPGVPAWQRAPRGVPGPSGRVLWAPPPRAALEAEAAVWDGRALGSSRGPGRGAPKAWGGAAAEPHGVRRDTAPSRRPAQRDAGRDAVGSSVLRVAAPRCRPSALPPSQPPFVPVLFLGLPLPALSHPPDLSGSPLGGPSRRAAGGPRSRPCWRFTVSCGAGLADPFVTCPVFCCGIALKRQQGSLRAEHRGDRAVKQTSCQQLPTVLPIAGLEEGLSRPRLLLQAWIEQRQNAGVALGGSCRDSLHSMAKIKPSASTSRELGGQRLDVGLSCC